MRLERSGAGHLADPARRALWGDTERAKRRLIFTLLEIGLPLLGLGDKQRLSFRLLADDRADTGALDPPPENDPIYTGHDNGRLTLNVVEADDVLREAIRKRLNEQYRTMLGHLRHEIGTTIGTCSSTACRSSSRSASCSATSAPTTRRR